MANAITSFETVQDGLAAELSLLNTVAEDHVSRFLVWDAAARALTLPERFSRNDRFSEASDRMKRLGWPVSTRRTGGGITPQGPGVINVAVAFQVPPKDAKSVPETYAAICDPLIHASATMGVSAVPGSVQGSFCDGEFNLEVGGRKLVGTAQRWRGAHVLCHALVLIDLDLPKAVQAAQTLSDGLDLGDRYDASVHVCLRDLVPSPETAGADFVKAITRQLVSLGYAG